MAITTTKSAVPTGRWQLLCTATAADEFSCCIRAPADYAIATSAPSEAIDGVPRGAGTEFIALLASGDKIYGRSPRHATRTWTIMTKAA